MAALLYRIFLVLPVTFIVWEIALFFDTETIQLMSFSDALQELAPGMPASIEAVAIDNLPSVLWEGLLWPLFQMPAVFVSSLPTLTLFLLHVVGAATGKAKTLPPLEAMPRAIR